MKHVIILHGFEGAPNSNWFPWLKQELIKNHYSVDVPAWPDPNHPDADVVLPWLAERLPEDTSNVILIGHSLGAYWAAKLAEEHNIDHLILVAPAVDPLPYDLYRDNWEDSDVDALEETIRDDIHWHQIQANKKTVIFSADDPLIPIANTGLFDPEEWAIEVLNGGEGHICVFELPEILKYIITS